ncbi:patatin-like phospholipase family protein [Nafulsella turpanensis]|uniref:patatin-like phospholipase family protein n=1 Tax=Nafulsella turpanensis TaxID=1265690 RepID=UPI00034AA5E8|nr:patatin-like phospholipase family protein [Nafulsella turpanensis]
MLKALYHSFPIRLLIHNIKNNQVLLFLWAFLFAVVTQNFGKVLGIPYLFLDPEYMYKVNFWSFFVIGIVLAAYTMAFHITCYILDGPKFPFLGTLPRPFGKFCINNSLIPLLFLLTYIICIIRFQLDYEYNTPYRISVYIGGLLSGLSLMIGAMFLYFRFTNQDIFRLFANNVNRKLKKIKITRANLIRRLAAAKNKPASVSYYLDERLYLRKVSVSRHFYDKEAILKVFDQNHMNSVIFELFILVVILVLGVFREHAVFQIPAAASSFLLLTIVLMFAGALSFWLRSWTITVVLAALLALNYTSSFSFFDKPYQAYGLNYQQAPVKYSLAALDSQAQEEFYLKDKENTLKILNNWRAKFPLTEKPKMVFICTSGGGQRAALWTVRSLQTADSLTGGGLMNQTMLMTGASGGLVGAAYFRELVLRQKQGEAVNPYDSIYLDRVSRDNLNPIIFSLLVNDLFIRYQKFSYNGKSYLKDRGYAFEKQFSQNTEAFLDKPLSAYREPEQKSLIPMMLVAPSITNDGRKLFISPQHVSYMTSGMKEEETGAVAEKVKGVDFLRFFQDHDAEDLRFLSALRMAATFPYITPNVSLPSEPPMKTMDSGIADNFGIEDATQFLYVFREWIAANTSGVIFLSIRDSEKNAPLEKNLSPTLFQKFFTPIENIYKNWTYIQDIKNENLLQFAEGWYDGDIHRIELQYIPRTMFDTEPADNALEEQSKLKEEEEERASLNWHLTTREKKNILDNIYLDINQDALKKLQELLGPEQALPRFLSKKEVKTSDSQPTGQAGALP